MVVRINDRGPFVSTRILDVSKRAADALGYRNQGTANVRVQLIGPAPLQDQGGRQVLALNEAMNDGASLDQLAALSQDENVQVADVAPRKKRREVVQQVVYEPDPQKTYNAGYIVRVAVFHDLETASEAYQEVANLGPTQIIRAVGAAGPLYRVQIGPLESEQDAQAALESAIGSGFDEARIVETKITQVSSN